MIRISVEEAKILIKMLHILKEKGVTDQEAVEIETYLKKAIRAKHEEINPIKHASQF